MEIQHRLNGTQVTKGSINKVLTLRPNYLMTPYDMLYKLVTNYLTNNNTYVVIKRDSLGNITELWPISYNMASIKEDKLGNLYLSFQFANGQIGFESLDNVICLKRHLNQSDIFGESNEAPMKPIVNFLYAIRQGIINALKTAGRIVGIIEAIGELNEKDRLAKKKQFEGDWLNAIDGGGVIVTDDTFKYQDIKQGTTTMIDAENVSLSIEKVCNYFGMSAKIYKGEYSEQEWNNFYEQVLEPMAIYFSQEFSYKVFSQRELDFGNAIEFIGDKLSYVSVQTKVDMFTALKELGVLSKGDIAKIFNLPTPPDSERYLESLNYMDSAKITEYQMLKAQSGTNTDDQGDNQDNA